MKGKGLFYILFLMCCSVPAAMFSACAPEADVRVGDLRCEYLVDPLGVDAPAPRLTWDLASETVGLRQTAYRIDFGTDRSGVAAGDPAGQWVDSGDMRVFWDGSSLRPFTRYYWKVTVRCNDDNEYSSEVASFETGMKDQANWKGEWISDGKSIDEKPAPYFRKEFSTGRKIASARAYITSAGLYEMWINGKRVGDLHLDPMYTKFDKRTLYSSYDITGLLDRNGENAVGVILGNGWYNHQSVAVWDFHLAYWRARPAFLLNIRLVYADGTEETIATDGSWKTTDNGPVIFNSIYTAEHYDARREMPGWDKPGFDDSAWNAAVVQPSPTERIVSQQLTPVRVINTYKAVKVDKKSDNRYVFHFPINMSGKIKLTVKGNEGTELRLIHAERLDADGFADLSNIDVHYRPVDDSDPFQTDIVTLSGRDDEFSPKFNYKGFQYVEVQSSEPIELTAANLVALQMHSDVPQLGRIGSSNPTLVKIWEASNNSYLSNMFGYPTDCPQREKNGWTGDAHINIETGLYNFDGITVYEKWLNDHMDEQRPDGVLPSIIPTAGWGYDWGNGPDWTSTISIIPWQIYMFYGDATLLKRTYGNLKRYVDHIDSISPDHITSWGLGDWVPVRTVSDKTLTSSLYYYVNAVILSKSAALQGNADDEARYAELADNIKNAINDKFLDRETGIYASGSQTELSAPLHWGVVPDDMREKVAANLYEKVRSNNFFLDVGLLGTKTILNALSDNGYADAAYKIAAQETYPSWGWWIVNGATTFYENWRIDAANDISLNHIMFGEVNAWLFKGLGGIFPDENAPGFSNVVLRPNFVEGLDSFSARHRSLYGEIVSSWERKDGEVIYNVVVPANSTATLYLNDIDGNPPAIEIPVQDDINSPRREGSKTVLNLDPGSYTFKIK